MILDSKRSDRADWRWLVGVFVLSYAFLVTVLPFLKMTSEKQLLQGVGVPALDHPFMDLRGVAAWCDASKEGKNPTCEQTFIKFQKDGEVHPNFLMNYSPFVLVLGKLGLSADSVVLWAGGLAVLYMISLWILCGPTSLQQSLFWALLICSPASALVVERSNLDILLFALLVAALLLRKQPWVESLIIFGASSFKFFPIVSLLALWKEDRKWGRPSVIITTIAFLIFLVMEHSRLIAISSSLAGQYQSAFGCTTIADLLTHYGILKTGNAVHVDAILKITTLIGLSGAFAAGHHYFSQHGVGKELSERSFHSFFLTGPIMVGLFVLGPQMDYKWIFFFFMVPAGLELIRSSHALEALAAKCWLGTVTLYSYWTFFSDEGSLRNALLKQVLMVLVIFLSAFLAGGIWNRKTAQ